MEVICINNDYKLKKIHLTLYEKYNIISNKIIDNIEYYIIKNNRNDKIF